MTRHVSWCREMFKVCAWCCLGSLINGALALFSPGVPTCPAGASPALSLALHRDGRLVTPKDESTLPATEGTNKPQPGTGIPSTSWADLVDRNNQIPMEKDNDGFTKVGPRRKRPVDSETAGRKAKRGCVQAAAAAALTERPMLKSKVQECTTTRQKKTAFSARSAVAKVEQCVYLEFCPDFSQAQYFLALEAKLGKGSVYQLTKMEGHNLVGLSSVQLADKLIEEGLDIEGTTLRTFPLRKRAERIVLGNIFLFVEDADLVAALRPYGQVISIVQKMMEMGDSSWADARRKAFITLNDRVKLSQIPARLDVKSKGMATHVYVTYGIKCSLCNRQGHKRANCPRKTGLQERHLGRGKVVAYTDDIVLFIRDDAQFELVPLIFEEFRMSSGVAVNFTKSCGLWCGSWKHRKDSLLGISWTSESLTVLGCTITTRNTFASQASHLMGLLERAIARLSPFTRGLSLLLARFVWSTSRVSWLPGRILARPVSDGGVGLLEIAGQLRLACLKGIQASLRGAANGYSWLVRSRAWLTPPGPDVWLSPRKRRLLSLWEAASSVLELDHRVLHPASLRFLRLRGDNRFLRPPDLLAPESWLQATPHSWMRLLRENASSSYHAEYEAETIILRGSATPITHLTSQRARQALDSARLQAHPTAELAARWNPTVDVPRSIPWADLRRNCFSGQDADVALRLALHALPHPDHPASRRANCAACGSSDGPLTHRYWSCRDMRPLLREVFASCEVPLDLQAWLFGVGLHPEVVKLTSVAKATIHK
ncbi:hypothetical protein LAZ67_8002989 [Cordylochernes scorpioides]|uniref:Reverse transcriptase domain-containing protein n=1 Tax=Cordylochernes scorpioides TaxID=51811 RepID=A0ABY6KWD2_9ARAC|nr:hypothetical protein LAZ67_8002989 [Cordylochernes scorpioides]